MALSLLARARCPKPRDARARLVDAICALDWYRAWPAGQARQERHFQIAATSFISPVLRRHRVRR